MKQYSHPASTMRAIISFSRMASGVVWVDSMFGVDAVNDRRDQTDLVAQAPEEVVEQGDGGGFAVGARDADQFELTARVAVECGGHVGHRGVGIRYDDVADRRGEVFGQPLADNGDRSGGDGRIDIGVPVALGAAHGEEAVPGAMRRESYASLLTRVSELPSTRSTCVALINS